MEQMSDHFIGYVAGYFADTNAGLHSKEIDSLLNEYAVKFDKDVPLEGDFQNKKVKMIAYLSYFNGYEQYIIIDDLCHRRKFKDNPKTTEILDQLNRKYGSFSHNSFENSDLVQTTKHWLEKYPDSKKQFDSAFAKISQGQFERNVLDDMRLAFELLLKCLLGNQKSLENQNDSLLKQLKDKDVPEEIRNLYWKTIDYYMKYQNDYVKHDDKVDENDLNFIIELTCLLMKYSMGRIGETNGQTKF